MSTTPDDGPKKRYTLTLHADGHTFPELVAHLKELKDELNSYLGGFDKGGRVILGGRGFIEVLYDPEQTPEKYDAELEAWYTKSRAEKEAPKQSLCSCGGTFQRQGIASGTCGTVWGPPTCGNCGAILAEGGGA